MKMAKKGGAKKAADGKKAKKPKKGSKRYTMYEKKDGKLVRKSPFCPKCGPGFFMADHKNRKTCGKCGYMEKK